MLQQRKENAGTQGIYQKPPLWSDLETPEEVEEDDPLEVLGRLIADKSKSFWRRVASKGNSLDKHATSSDVNEGTTTREELEHASGSLRCGELPLPSDLPNQTLELSDNHGGDTVKNSLRREDKLF
jgi:hypothetical protein